MHADNLTTTNTSTNANATHISKHVVFLVPVMMGAFIGNALVILAFLKGPRKIRTFTNYFVVNLAVSDLMVGCLSLPLWIVMMLGLTNATFKKFMVPLDILFGVTSIYSLVLISCERLYAVKYPAKHFNLERRTVRFAIGFIWSLGIVLFVAEAVIIHYEKELNPVWVTTLVFITFAMPVATITISYFVLYVTAANLMKADNQTATLSREIRVAKTVSVIISLFCVCWAPFFVVNLLYAYKVIITYNPVAVHVTKALHYLNSMMNVFVYAVRSPDFRDTFKKLICDCGHSIRQRALLFLSIKQPRMAPRSQLTVFTQKSLILDSLPSEISEIHEANVNYRLSNGTCIETLFTDDEDKEVLT